MIDRDDINNLAKEIIWTKNQLENAENNLGDINRNLLKTSKIKWMFFGLRNHQERSFIQECKAQILFLEDKSLNALNEFLVQEVWRYFNNNPNALLHFKAIEQKHLKEKMIVEILEEQIDLLPPCMFSLIGPHILKLTWDFMANRTYYYG